MSQQFGNFFLRQPPQTAGHGLPKPGGAPARPHPPARKPVFTKIFRWRLPEGQTREPDTVEVAGTFTGWKKVPLKRSPTHDGWQVALHNIPVHRTHHYMLLVDGQPVADDNNDGYAIPHGPQETQFQLMTDRGPRVFMLFAQTK